MVCGPWTSNDVWMVGFDKLGPWTSNDSVVMCDSWNSNDLVKMCDAVGFCEAWTYSGPGTSNDSC